MIWTKSHPGVMSCSLLESVIGSRIFTGASGDWLVSFHSSSPSLLIGASVNNLLSFHS